MKKEIFLLIIFCFFIPLLLFISSYKTVLAFSSLTSAQQNTIDFLQGKEALKITYTSREIAHLEDVRKVMKITNAVFYFSLLVCALILTSYRKNKNQALKVLKYGSITTIIVLIFMILAALLNFTTLFTIFHQIFFPQGNWLFPPNSLLIQTFPVTFFYSISITIFLFTFCLGLGIGVISILIKRGAIGR